MKLATRRDGLAGRESDDGLARCYANSAGAEMWTTLQQALDSWNDVEAELADFYDRLELRAR